MKDDKGRPDLASVLPQPWQKALHPVGRLDADTTGLLLFCRDGELTHRLLHPKYIVEREYLATVENSIDEASLRAKLAEGVVTIEDGEELVVQGDLLSVDGQVVRAIFREGKYRMVRRVLANCGHPVVALHRERYGEAEMAEAAKREYQPAENLIEIVQEEGGATREEALEALRNHDGDIVKALEEVLNS